MTSAEYQQLVELLTRQAAGVTGRFGDVDRQFAEVNRQFAGVNRQFVAVDRRFADVDRRFGEIALGITTLRQEVLGHFDDVYRRFERLEQEYQAITQALRRIEGRQ